MTTKRLSIDPTELKPGDIVVYVSDHEESGCHCDVEVIVDRPGPDIDWESFDRWLDEPGTGV